MPGSATMRLEGAMRRFGIVQDTPPGRAFEIGWKDRVARREPTYVFPSVIEAICYVRGCEEAVRKALPMPEFERLLQQVYRQLPLLLPTLGLDQLRKEKRK